MIVNHDFILNRRVSKSKTHKYSVIEANYTKEKVSIIYQHLSYDKAYEMSKFELTVSKSNDKIRYFVVEEFGDNVDYYINTIKADFIYKRNYNNILNGKRNKKESE